MSLRMGLGIEINLKGRCVILMRTSAINNQASLECSYPVSLDYFGKGTLWYFDLSQITCHCYRGIIIQHHRLICATPSVV